MTSKILVVEDESLIALDIKQRLLYMGYEVTATADSAETTLSSLDRELPNLILMDINIKGKLDGIATAALTRDRFNLPVVFLTSHTDTATLEKAKANQPYGYITKPFENHNLSTAIEIALARHKAETALQSALSKERELNELKSNFISIVSHELRNPLSTILLSIDILENKQNSPEFSQKRFARVRAAVKRMTKLLNQVLITGQAEAEQLKLQPVSLNLLEFCKEIIDEFQASLGSDRSIVFSSNGLSTKQTYYLDPNLLTHIIINLLSNAVKYSPKDSNVYFEVSSSPSGVVFHIQDRGIGILPKDLDNLFTAFHRGGNVQRIPGTGLGLSIVKQCVDTHRGTISVESEVGKGTKFTVTL